jgi:citrate lyase subunit beta/citryl-CoA lyase
VIAAFNAPENSGKGALRVDGKMAERLHLAQAERLVAVAQAIGAKAALRGLEGFECGLSFSPSS